MRENPGVKECVSSEWLSVNPEQDSRQHSVAMVRTPTAVVSEGEVAIKIKVVTPRFPESDVEALQLEEDLERMGCLQLLNRPWGVKSEYMIQELRV